MKFVPVAFGIFIAEFLVMIVTRNFEVAPLLACLIGLCLLLILEHRDSVSLQKFIKSRGLDGEYLRKNKRGEGSSETDETGPVPP